MDILIQFEAVSKQIGIIDRLQEKAQCTEGDVKVDRERLQEQLRQFHLDKEKMRNKGVNHTPRARRQDDLRITGSGDNRSTSPTIPIASRVSGKEKRRRVHAWLGAQVGSETDSMIDKSLENSPSFMKLKCSDVAAPGLPSFARNLAAGVDADVDSHGKEDNSDLLCSNSEFLPSDHGPVRQMNGESHPFGGNSASVAAYATRLGLGPLSQEYIGQSELRYSKNAAGDFKKSLAPDFSGGGDNYCYVYDPVIARAYTKKYPINPPVNAPAPSTTDNNAVGRDISVAKHAPASENFTPSPNTITSNAFHGSFLPHDTVVSGSSPNTFTKFSHLHPSSAYQGPTKIDSNYSLPTKYEEYDMRPIKPLDVGLKKSLYGESAASTDNVDPPKHQQPRPYLRRSHTSGVTYPLPKSAVKSKDKHATTKHAAKVQANIEVKRKVAGVKGPTYPSPLTPRKKKQQRRTPKEKSAHTPVKSNQDEGECSEVSENDPKKQPPNELTEPAYGELPVDLKHVKAATKIQAVWKGYRTRKLDPKVVEIRQEVRARRAEQYISVLCHEVQCLKENLDAEKKMRDLQTEAIRYIWSQLRLLQKRKNHKEDNGDATMRKRPSERRPRSKSNSPRRGVKRASARTSSPHGFSGSSINKTPRHVSESSALDIEDDTESVNSCEMKHSSHAQVQPDVSWKEVPDDKLFQNRPIASGVKIRKQDIGCQAADDTDEGRGTLVTDGEGNPAHSSAEDEQPTSVTADLVQRTELEAAQQNSKLGSTIGVLQDQISQLQDAMLALTDKIVNRSRVNMDAWDEEDDLKLVAESQDTSPVCPSQKLVTEKLKATSLSPEPALSARGEVPRISLKNALNVLQSALSENELWALCEQAGHHLKSKPIKKYIALETVYLRKDGRVEFQNIGTGEESMDDMYLAPEILEKKANPSVKTCIFSLSVVLWSAADWEMSAEQAPQLSDELESLLVVMSQDDPEQRAHADEVIQICEDHHAKAGANSLCICSSLFAEIEDALTLAKSGKVIQKKIVQEVTRDHEIVTKTLFKENVLPDINSCEWRSKLKPASSRVLSPRRNPEPTPHEKLMSSLTLSKPNLRTSPRPKIFSVRDMFLKDPELVHKLNILPGQRRKNQKAMRLVMRRQSPKDPSSAPIPGVPTPPRALRAGVSEVANVTGHSSVILRWHPSKIFDKYGQEAKEEKVIGYRIYVNGHPKGMVAGGKSRALLEGLRHSTEYRVHVRSISSLGESDPSNTVIAHITSSPLPQVSKEEAAGVENPLTFDYQSDNVGGMPVAPPRRRPHTAPQAKPRLGAVFPQQKKSKDDLCERTTIPIPQDTSSSGTSQKEDDIIDRVLKRYGIQQAGAIVPGFASASTLSPMPLGYKPKSSLSAETNKRSDDSSVLTDFIKPAKGSVVSRKDSKESGASSSQAAADMTSKSLELLSQLKTDLLS